MVWFWRFVLGRSYARWIFFFLCAFGTGQWTVDSEQNRRLLISSWIYTLTDLCMYECARLNDGIAIITTEPARDRPTSHTIHRWTTMPTNRWPRWFIVNGLSNCSPMLPLRRSRLLLSPANVLIYYVDEQKATMQSHCKGMGHTK